MKVILSKLIANLKNAATIIVVTIVSYDPLITGGAVSCSAVPQPASTPCPLQY